LLIFTKRTKTNFMSKEKTIKNALAWVVKRGYMPNLDEPERKSEGFVCDYRNGVPGFTQIYSVVGEEVLQPASFVSVDEVYRLMISEPIWK